VSEVEPLRLLRKLIREHRRATGRPPSRILVSVDLTSEIEGLPASVLGSTLVSQVAVDGIESVDSLYGVPVEWNAPSTLVA
jgi:hypothetical protein